MKAYIDSKTHSVLDYTVALFIIALPWIFGFSESERATWVSLVTGCLIILLALFTRYEGGVFKVIPLTTHLIADILLGTFLAASPWIFLYSDITYWPHFVFGCLGLVIPIITLRALI